MDREVAERVSSALAVVAALCVGLFLGGKYCAEVPPVVEPAPEVTPEKVCPEPTPCLDDVDMDPPDAPAPAPEEEMPEPKTPARRELPEAPPVLEPKLKQRLLAFVRDNASELKRCREPQGAVRLGVLLDVQPDGRVKRVSFQAGKDELEPQTLECLRTRILEWEVPEEFFSEDQRVMFSLIL
jgi:hypothetical protein